MPKESFFVVPILYNKPWIHTGDLLKRLFKFETLGKVWWDCKLEHFKMVRNEKQHTKTTEDEEVI